MDYSLLHKITLYPTHPDNSVTLNRLYYQGHWQDTHDNSYSLEGLNYIY